MLYDRLAREKKPCENHWERLAEAFLSNRCRDQITSIRKNRVVVSAIVCWTSDNGCLFLICFHILSAVGDKNSGSIDMLLVVEITCYGDDERASDMSVTTSLSKKKSSNDCRFNVDMGERVYKFKASTPESCQRYVL